MYFVRAVFASRAITYCVRQISRRSLFTELESKGSRNPFVAQTDGAKSAFNKKPNPQICFAGSQKRLYSPENIQPSTLCWISDFVEAELHFMENRSVEVKQVFDHFVQSLLAQYELVPSNDVKLRIVLASQMVGSGKTLFGRSFLSAASSRREEWQQLYQTKGEKFVVEEILAAEHIEFNLSRLPGNFTIEQATSFFLNLLCNALVGKTGRSETPLTREELELHWNNRANLVVDDMLSYFQRRLQCKLFIHLDEVDYVLQTTAGCIPTPDAIQRLYDFWRFFINAIVQHSLCYCSGRSPSLLKLGRGYYSSKLNMGSAPASVAPIFFDRLFPNNIANIIKQNYPTAFSSSHNKLEEKIKLLADQVYYWTAGIPRLVHAAIAYYRKNYCPNDQSAPGDLDTLMPKDLIAKWSKFVAYCSNSSAIVAELGNYAALKDNPELQRLYLKVAQEALMATPYSLDLSLEPSLDNLQQLWILGIYTAKTSQLQSEPATLTRSSNGKVILYPILPRVVFQYLTQTQALNDPVFRTVPSDYFNPGPVSKPENRLETKGVECFAYRIKDKFQRVIPNHTTIDIDNQAANLFPFLMGTCLANSKFEPLRNAFRLPKMMKAESKSEAKEGRIVLTLKTELNTEAQVAQAKVSQWKTILAYVETGLYIPFDKSSSGDAYYFWKNSRSIDTLVFQFKAGMQALSLSSISTEVNKAVGSLPSTVRKAVVVFIGGYSDTLQKYAVANTNYGWKIQLDKLPANAKLRSLMEARKLDVLILNESGQELLLSSFVLSQT